MKKENVKSADKKPEVYTDDKGRKRVRMVSVDREIVKTNEKAVSKAQQKFFGIVRGLQKGKIKNASPDAKKAATSMSKKDVKDFAATKHKGLPAKKESTVAYGKSMDAIANKKKKAAISKPDLDKLSKLKDLMKRANESVEEGYIGAKGEKGRDYHNAGTFDKDTAYSHAKKHNGVVHKDPSGKYLVKHGKGKHVGEATDAEVKKKQDFLDRLRGKPPVRKEATMADKAGPGKGKDMRDMSKLDHAKARDWHQYRVKTKGDYHSKMAKIHHANAIGGSSMMHKEEDEACWDGYKQVGMKKKGNKSVPNCVPESFKSFIGEAIKLTPAEIKRRDAKKAARDADGRSSAARKARKANPPAPKPKPAPKKQTARKDTYDKADLHPIMQLRKVVDNPKHVPTFHLGKSGKVDAKDAADAIKFYERLPVMGKRQLQIRIAKGGPAAVKQAADAYRGMRK